MNTPEYQEFVKNDFIIDTAGEYSAYSIQTLYRVLKKFNFEQKLTAWKILVNFDEKDYPKESRGYRYHYRDALGKTGHFTVWLEKEGFLEELSHKEINRSLNENITLC